MNEMVGLFREKASDYSVLDRNMQRAPGLSVCVCVWVGVWVCVCVCVCVCVSAGVSVCVCMHAPLEL